MSDAIVNKVSESVLITINLEDYYHPGERVVFDRMRRMMNKSGVSDVDYANGIAMNDEIERHRREEEKQKRKDEYENDSDNFRESDDDVHNDMDHVFF